MSENVIYLLLILPVSYVSVFFHELGHVVCGRLSGAVPLSFGLGMGRVFFVCSVGGVRFYVGARRPFQGITFLLYPQLVPEGWRRACTLSGGILANSLATALF